MKHVGEEIHRIIEAKKLIKKDVAAQAHMTYANLASIKHKSSIDCQLLEDLCKVIGVNPAYFFDDNQKNNHMILTKIIILQIEKKKCLTIYAKD